MKKIYFLLSCLITLSSFGQILSEDFNYADGALLTANGWSAFSGANTNPIDVGASNGLIYAGYSGTTGITGVIAGNAAKLDNTGEDVQKVFTAVTTGTLYYSFLINVTDGTTGYFAGLNTTGTNFGNRIYVKPSTTPNKINFGISNTSTATYGTTDFDINTTYLIIVKYDVSTSGANSLWIKQSEVPASEIAAGAPEITTTNSGSATISAFFLRQPATAQNITIDGLRIYSTWFGATPCALTLATETTTCDAITLNIDTYSASIPFTGGGTASYTMSTTSGTISGDNPSTTATGNIIISGVTEGTSNSLTISGGCNIVKTISAPECKPINPLPYNESFPYTVGNTIGSEQKWINLFTGDDVLVSSGSLSYTGITSTGNSISFVGAGKDPFTPFTTVTSGTVYASFLFSVTSMSNVTVDLTETYFASLTDDLKGYLARIFIKKSGTQYLIGFDNAATTTNYDTTLRNVGDVIYVVLSYDFATNSLKAWINPTVAAFNATNPTLVNTPILISPATSFVNIGGFVLRQGDDNKTPAIVFDELKVGTTYADLGVTLATEQNEIDGLKVYPNPVANGMLHVETASNLERSIVMFDVLGKKVFSTTTDDTILNVASLKSGVYILKITEAGKTATRKVIIK
jgi:hypothetical protein